MARSELSHSAQSVILSVVIPCYNHGEYLLEAIASVEACLDPVYEIVIVNDGSTDPLTLNVLHYLSEHGYFVLNQPNQGLSSARNSGITKSQGRYILPLDADNRIRSDYILKSIDVLDQASEIGVVYGKPQWFGDTNRSWEIPEEFDAGKLILGNYIDACAVFRKSLWEDCGGYDVNMPTAGLEDWEFWLSAIEKGWKFHYIPEVLFEYRVRGDSMAATCSRPENLSQLLRYIYTKHARLYITRFPQILEEREIRIGKLQEHIGNLDAYQKQLLNQIGELEQTISQQQESTQHLQTQLKQQQESNQHLQIQLHHKQAEIAAMESSKFWKLRQIWMNFNRFLLKR